MRFDPRENDGNGRSEGERAVIGLTITERLRLFQSGAMRVTPTAFDEAEANRLRVRKQREARSEHYREANRRHQREWRLRQMRKAKMRESESNGQS